MPISLFRTHRTWLTEDQLLLLDVLFKYAATFRMLRQAEFRNTFMCHPHGLDNDQLRCNLRWLCEHGVLTSKREETDTRFYMTANGGDLWSQERCPVWERYCREYYPRTSDSHTLMSVIAVSPQVRDDFLALWPPPSARRRPFIITDSDYLLGWRSFHPVFVGLATYREQHVEFPAEEWPVRSEEMYRQIQEVEANRTWWRSVYELQRFVAKTA